MSNIWIEQHCSDEQTQTGGVGFRLLAVNVPHFVTGYYTYRWFQCINEYITWTHHLTCWYIIHVLFKCCQTNSIIALEMLICTERIMKKLFKHLQLNNFTMPNPSHPRKPPSLFIVPKMLEHRFYLNIHKFIPCFITLRYPPKFWVAPT